MKVLFLTMGDEKHPSSQVRVYQFIRHFENMGIQCVVYPFITMAMRERMARAIKSGEFINKVDATARIILTGIVALAKRAVVIISANKYDVVVSQKDILPFGLQDLLKWRNPNIIFEFDDAIWETSPRQEKRPAILKFVHRNNTKLFYKMIQKSKIILVNNSYQAGHARKFHDNVKEISAPIDTDKYKPTITSRKDNEITLGWIGSWSTSYMLEDISGALERVGEKYGDKVKLRNINGTPFKLKNMKVENIAWENDEIQSDLAKLDIGLMPLDDLPVNRGRLGYKMIIYMSLGIPYVAQDIGLNREVTN
ncbi:MAG: hypothetical protein Q8Q06_01160, partial [bacterium]|nr:hypothetical protein [bacterium]